MSTTSDLSDLSEENFDSKLDDSLVNVTEVFFSKISHKLSLNVLCMILSGFN